MTAPDTAKLVIGYRTKPIVDVEQLLPKFEPPANYKDADKIAGWLEATKTQWLREAKDMPYTGTFDEVMIVDPRGERPGRWYSKDRGPGGAKSPICVAVRSWLLKAYPKAWSTDTHPVHSKPEVVFLGFEPRAFLKMLGIECSLPENAQPLPAGMWYGNTDHRDIAEACIPREYAKLISWATVFKRRGIKPKADWVGPGNDPEEDVRLIAELGAQLGFLDKV